MCVGMGGNASGGVCVGVKCLGLFFALGLLACTPLGERFDDPYTGPVNTCRTNSDCEIGTCHPGELVCVQTKQTTDVLMARVSFEASYLKPQMFIVPVVSTESHVLQIRHPVPVQNISLDMDADILFANLTDTLPGTAPDVSVYRTYLTESDFMLLPGMYRITIYPVGDDAKAYAITTLTDIRMDDNGVLWSGNAALDMASVPGERTRLVNGKVSYASTVDAGVDASDLLVQAFLPNSEVALSRAFPLNCREGVNQPDPGDCGYFSIPLPNDITAVALRFTKPDEPFFLAYTETIEGIGTSTESHNISLEQLEKPVFIQGKIGVTPGVGAPSVPPECHVVFESVDENRSLTYQVRSNGYGEVERAEGLPGVYLYPGRYAVKAFPKKTSLPVSSLMTRTTFSRTLVVTHTPDDESLATEPNIAVNGFSFQLQPRIAIEGTVELNGVQMPQVELTAYNISGKQPFNNVIRGISDANGNWRAWMDNDVYYLVAKPPKESGFAAGVQVWNILSSTTYRFDATVEIPFVIGGTVAIDTGQERFRNMQPDDVQIDWYRISAQSPYPVGQTEVQTGFAFTALLPAE